jgi:hypothetical protein
MSKSLELRRANTLTLPEGLLQTDRSVPELENKKFVDEVFWGRITRRLCFKDYEFAHHFGDLDKEIRYNLAERVVDQTVAFLRLHKDTSPEVSYTPSRIVDMGRHALLLYDEQNEKLSYELAGRRVHHRPMDEPGVDYSINRNTVSMTVTAMENRAITVDYPLWTEEAGSDSQSCS